MRVLWTRAVTMNAVGIFKVPRAVAPRSAVALAYRRPSPLKIPGAAIPSAWPTSEECGRVKCSSGQPREIYRQRMIDEYDITPENAFADWREAAAAEKFADAVASTRAGHVIFTIGQHTGKFCAPNAAYEKLLGVKNGEWTSRRDLILEISKALEKRDVRLIIYMTARAPMRHYRVIAAMGDTLPTINGKPAGPKVNPMSHPRKLKGFLQRKSGAQSGVPEKLGRCLRRMVAALRQASLRLVVRWLQGRDEGGVRAVAKGAPQPTRGWLPCARAILPPSWPSTPARIRCCSFVRGASCVRSNLSPPASSASLILKTNRSRPRIFPRPRELLGTYCFPSATAGARAQNRVLMRRHSRNELALSMPKTAL